MQKLSVFTTPNIPFPFAQKKKKKSKHRRKRKSLWLLLLLLLLSSWVWSLSYLRNMNNLVLSLLFHFGIKLLKLYLPWLEFYFSILFCNGDLISGSCSSFISSLVWCIFLLFNVTLVLDLDIIESHVWLWLYRRVILILK